MKVNYQIHDLGGEVFLRKPLIAEGIGCDAVFWIKKEIV